MSVWPWRRIRSLEAALEQAETLRLADRVLDDEEKGRQLADVRAELEGARARVAHLERRLREDQELLRLALALLDRIARAVGLPNGGRVLDTDGPDLAVLVADLAVRERDGCEARAGLQAVAAALPATLRPTAAAIREAPALPAQLVRELSAMWTDAEDAARRWRFVVSYVEAQQAMTAGQP